MSESKLLQLSVGIPAHNEQHNIASLLRSILSQESLSYELLEVLVFCDGCTDQTAQQASTVADARIVVVNDGKRLGKVARCNEMFVQMRGNLFLQLDGDVALGGSHVLEALVNEYVQSQADIVCANLKPLPPRTFVERLANWGIGVWTDILDQLGPNKTMVHHCIGRARLFSKKFCTEFVFPPESNPVEDVYSYYRAVQMGMHVSYANAAVVRYRLPDSLTDYVKQMHRFLQTAQSIETMFDHKLISRHDQISLKIKLAAFLRHFFRAPLKALGYLFLQLFAHSTVGLAKQKIFWDTVESTKRV